MANEMFSSLPDVMTAKQLVSALQISKSEAYALLSRSDFPNFGDRRTENGDEKGSAEQTYQQTAAKMRC